MYDYEIWQMDVKTTFVKGELKKDVYMTQHVGFTPAPDHNKVCKLQRFIFGLKQASRSWNIRCNNILKMLDFVRYEE